MSTIEELQGMTHEDLVRRIQELQEDNEKLSKEKKEWVEYYTKLKDKFDNCKKAIQGVISLTD